jgi:hypothetical protein
MALHNFILTYLTNARLYSAHSVCTEFRSCIVCLSVRAVLRKIHNLMRLLSSFAPYTVYVGLKGVFCAQFLWHNLRYIFIHALERALEGCLYLDLRVDTHHTRKVSTSSRLLFLWHFCLHSRSNLRHFHKSTLAVILVLCLFIAHLYAGLVKIAFSVVCSIQIRYRRESCCGFCVHF